MCKKCERCNTDISQIKCKACRNKYLLENLVLIADNGNEIFDEEIFACPMCGFKQFGYDIRLYNEPIYTKLQKKWIGLNCRVMFWWEGIGYKVDNKIGEMIDDIKRRTDKQD